MSRTPSVFISYSWDDDEHKAWVRELAERLVLNGVRVKLDQWDLVPGDSLTEFMEGQIISCDFVLVVCTPEYAKKSTARLGGVGYEQQIISGSLASGIDRRKFIPVVRRGEIKAGEQQAVPAHFQGILAIDMRGPEGINDHLEKLLRAVFKVPALTAPPLGRPPAFTQAIGDETKPTKPARLSTLEFDGWALLSGVASNEQHPDTFFIPTAEERSGVIASDFVKLSFEIVADDSKSEGGVSVFGERMWVRVMGAYGPYFWGTLANDPSFDGHNIGLEHGSEIIFLPEHILDIVNAEQQAKDEEEYWSAVEKKKKSEKAANRTKKYTKMVRRK